MAKEDKKIRSFFQFLQDRGEYRIPLTYKLVHNIKLEQEDLTVNGDLNLVGNEFDIYYNSSISEITSLPDNLTVRGSLDLGYNKSIQHLPNHLRVGILEAAASGLKTLPEDLTVDSYIDISDTKIERLPPSWVRLEDLHAGHSSLRFLPNKLDVFMNLFLYNCPIEKLPDKLRVGNKLNISKCKNLKKLPDGLRVGKHLIMDHLSITELPRKLYVGGNLILGRTPIKSLPGDLKVDGLIVIKSKNPIPSTHENPNLEKQIEWATDEIELSVLEI